MRGQSYPHVRTYPRHQPWYEQDGGMRLAHDQACVTVLYPDLAYSIDDETQCVSLEGHLRLLAECGIPTDIQMRLVFPISYPKCEPRVFDTGGQFPHHADRHFYSDGQCCLWLPPESRWKAEDTDGLCRFLEEVAVFFDRQLIYDAEGKGIWPGKQRSHGDAGYREFVQEMLGGDQHLLEVLAPTFANRSGIGRNSFCPCGSGRKYKKCHLQMVDTIARRVEPIKLYRIFCRWCDQKTTDEK